MVHFEPSDGVVPFTAVPISEARSKIRARAVSRARVEATEAPNGPGASSDRSADAQADAQPDTRAVTLAPVTYLRGAGPAASAATSTPHQVDEQVLIDAGFAAAAAADSAAEVEREHAEQVLLQRLRARSLSATEARTILVGTEIAKHEIEEIIDRFAELGYIDEGKLADQILHSHHERKGLGRSGVQAEMRRRGLDHDLILEKLEELPDDETERAIELACKRVEQMSRLDDQTIDRRLTGFLMRKGYASSAVRLAVKAALESRSGSGGASRVRFR